MLIGDFASPWGQPSQTLHLENGAVHVWRASLDQGPLRIQVLEQTLSADERERASSFRFPNDRKRYVASRGILRDILGRYRGIDPASLRFRYNPWGKPALSGESADGLRFNVSHSAGRALYAVARGREVGVDLECLRPFLARDPIAERVFSPSEVAALRSLPREMQSEAFFIYWTLKEAFIKATGKGHAIPLDAFEVLPSSEGPGAALTISCQPQEACRWSLRKLSLGPGFIAALAVEGQGWDLQCWEWPE